MFRSHVPASKASVPAYVAGDRYLLVPGKVNGAIDTLTGIHTGLAGVTAALAAVEPWDKATTEGAVRAFADAAGVKLGKVAQPIRAAVTGRTTSPPIFDVLSVLGRDESLARLRDHVTP